MENQLQIILIKSCTVKTARTSKLVWHAGDVGYADDSFLHFPCYTHFCYEKRYDEYMDRIQDQMGRHKTHDHTGQP